MKKVIFILTGNLMMAVAIAMVILPSGILTGGITGVAVAANHYLHLPVSLAVGVINFAVLLLGYVTLGKKVLGNTLISVISFPLLLEVCGKVQNVISLEEYPLASSILGAAMLSIGLAMILKQDGSTGGGDLLAMVIHKKTGVSLAVMVNVIDGAILLLQATFRPIGSVIYGMAMIAVMTIVLNLLMSGNSININKLLDGKPVHVIKKTYLLTQTKKQRPNE